MQSLGVVASHNMKEIYKFALLLASLLAIANGKGAINDMDINQEARDETDNEVDVGSGGDADTCQNLPPNIGKVFSGYDMVRGSPFNFNGDDPGFGQKIFTSVCSEGRRSNDFMIPNGIEFEGRELCNGESATRTILTERQLQDTFFTEVGVSGSRKTAFATAAFALNAGYKSLVKSLRNKENTIITVSAACSVYKASIKAGNMPKFTENFLNFANKAMKTKKYTDVFRTFGTHYVDSIIMGSRYTKVDVISKKSLDKLEEESIDVSAAARASARNNSISIHSSVGKTSIDAKKYKDALTDSKWAIVGAVYPNDGNIEEWKKRSWTSPAPIYYKLRSIKYLFSELATNTDEFDDGTVDDEISEALKGYCLHLKPLIHDDVECEGPRKDCSGGNMCSANAICINKSDWRYKENAYKCVCDKRYYGNGRVCVRDPDATLTREIKHNDYENTLDAGDWGQMDICAKNGFARGFKLRVLQYQSSVKDDSAANGLCIVCTDGTEKCSDEGYWGEWSKRFMCKEGSYLAGWKQLVETYALFDDVTGVNNVVYQCRDIEESGITDTLPGKGLEFGGWTHFQSCLMGEFICGVQTRTHPNYGLTDIKHQCCKSKYTFRKKANKFRMKGRH